jgi:hypothetical protein
MRPAIRARYVRVGLSASLNVRFAPESGHVQCTRSCPLRANSGHFAIAVQRHQRTTMLEQMRVSPVCLSDMPKQDWSVGEACMNNIIYLVGLVVVVVAVLSFFGLR